MHKPDQKASSCERHPATIDNQAARKKSPTFGTIEVAPAGGGTRDKKANRTFTAHKGLCAKLGGPVD